MKDTDTSALIDTLFASANARHQRRQRELVAAIEAHERKTARPKKCRGDQEQCNGFEARPGARGLPQCRMAATNDGYCSRHHPDVLRRKVDALHAEAAMNAENIRARGGAPVNARVKKSNIVALGEALHDPDARQHTPDGFPVFNNLTELRNYAKIKEIKEGRRMRIDPDGGPPTSADKRVEAEAWRARRNARGNQTKTRSFGKRLMERLGRTE